MTSKPRPDQIPSKQAIRRAVASSTAIETGKPIRQIEKQLREQNPKFRSLALAK